MGARRFRILFGAAVFGAATLSLHADGTGAPLIVDAAWLSTRLGSPDLVVVEVATRPQDYKAGHIPGAVYLERSAIYDTVNGVQGMFPGVERAVDAFERLGVGNASTVVLYDASDSLWAARAFWALEYLGHRNAHVLNGGLAEWKARRLSTSAEVPAPLRGRFEAKVDQERVADKDAVLACYASPDVKIVDARSSAEYAGTDVRAKRAGHIPGAANIDWQLAASDDGRKLFLDEKELGELYQDAGITRDKTIVLHCQTGVRAAHTYLVLRSLGYAKVRLYDGSWEEWGNDQSTPIVQGRGGTR